MRRNGRVGLSVVDSANPDNMASLEEHVVEVRPDSPLPSHGPISIKNTSARFSQPRSTPSLLRDRRRQGLAAHACLVHKPGR